MRIAFIVGRFPSLSVTFVIDQITSLIDRGHDVDIYAVRPEEENKIHSTVEAYRLLDHTTYFAAPPESRPTRISAAMSFLFAHPSGGLFRAWRRFACFKRAAPALRPTLVSRATAFLPERRYDIIHCHFGPNALVGLFARDAGILHGKLITTFHGYDVNTYPRKHGHDVYRRLFQRGDLFTANSRFTAGRAEALGCPKDKIVVLPVGVDLGDFKHTVRKATPGEEIRLLTVARLVEVKGIEYGIRAVARVTRSFPRIRYQIVGDGPMLTQLRELADNLGVAGSVDFLGGQTRDEVGRLYDRAHLFLLPGVVGSDGAQEGQGLVLLEAQACGIPVLATRVGGIPESVLDGDSGYLVGQRDVDALSKKLAHLIEHPELWPEMGRKGRALVEGKFDADSLHEQLVGIYQGVLKGA
ncbi:MAG: glycosyltransferase [Planctomycetota bacterium]